MTLNAQGYFKCLKFYLSTNYYGEPQASGSELVLKKKIFGQSGGEPIEYKVRFKAAG